MKQLNIAQALNEAMDEEMARDPTVFAFGENVADWGQGGIYGVNDGLVAKYGEGRFRDTPISEEAIVGLAVGAAVGATRPVAEIMYVDFMGLAMDALVNQAAKMRYMFGGKATVPLVIRTQEGAGRGTAAQHSQSLEAWFVHIPGLKVCAPSTAADAKGLLKSAIRDDNPVVFLEHKQIYFERSAVPEDEDFTIPLGLADVKREGSDVTIVTFHALVGKALKAAEELSKEGIEVEVVDPRTLFPLDIDTIIDSVQKTGRVLIAHEGYERCGVGAEIATQIMEQAFDYLDAPVKRVCAKNVPVPYNAGLETAAIPQKEDLVKAVRELVA